MTRVLNLRLHTLILLLMHFKTKYQILKGKKKQVYFQTVFDKNWYFNV